MHEFLSSIEIQRIPDTSGQYESAVAFNARNIAILTGKSNPDLARNIAQRLKLDLGEPITVFPDQETYVKIPRNLRKKHTFIIQPTGASQNGSPNDHLMALYFMVNAARRASAGEISVVIPYYAYA